MKIFKKILWAVAGFGILLFIGSYFLPSEFSVEREIDINGDATTAATAVKQLSNWDKWSYWSWDMDTTLVITHKLEESSGKVVRIASGDKIGTLIIRPMESSSNENLEFEMSHNEGEHIMHVVVGFYKVNSGLRIKWTQSGKFRRDPLEKYMGLSIDKKLGRQIEESLKGLKEFVENGGA